MSYNLRYDTANDGVNQWSNRRSMVRDQLKFYAPLVFGTQEGLKHQLDQIKEDLERYEYLGVGRNDGKEAGEYTAIFYDQNELSLEDSGTFWLSESPEKPSKGWDAALERICSFGKFTHKESAKKFYVFNTHFDHIGVEARKKSAELIFKKIKEINAENLPFILMGDLNSNPQTTQIQFLSEVMLDSKTSAEVTFGPEGTFNSFDYNHPLNERIDFIFVSRNGWKVHKYAAFNDPVNKLFPSDHLPVYTEVSIK